MRVSLPQLQGIGLLAVNIRRKSFLTENVSLITRAKMAQRKYNFVGISTSVFDVSTQQAFKQRDWAT